MSSQSSLELKKALIELDAEKVMFISRHILAREVVSRGFMSNFLFTNISNIFGAPKYIFGFDKTG